MEFWNRTYRVSRYAPGSEGGHGDVTAKLGQGRCPTSAGVHGVAPKVHASAVPLPASAAPQRGSDIIG